jgi:ribosomal protein S27E
MGLFSSESYYCAICGNEATEDNAVSCNNCGAVLHGECLKRIGNAKKVDRLIRGDTVKVKCSECGHVGSVS